LLRGTPFDAEDLQAIREVLDERERELQDQLQQRLADQEGQGGNSTGIRRLGVGWLERYWVERRWGPYLRLRWRDGLRKRMKYIGKVESK
jgi:hypothetical protein